MSTKHPRAMITLAPEAFARLEHLAAGYGLTVATLLRAVAERVAEQVQVHVPSGRPAGPPEALSGSSFPVALLPLFRPHLGHGKGELEELRWFLGRYRRDGAGPLHTFDPQDLVAGIPAAIEHASEDGAAAPPAARGTDHKGGPPSSNTGVGFGETAQHQRVRKGRNS